MSKNWSLKFKAILNPACIAIPYITGNVLYENSK